MNYDWIPTVKLRRQCGPEHPDGVKAFLAEGLLWGYRYNADRQWVRKEAGELGQHGGVDVLPGHEFNPLGVKVYAPADGTLIRAGWQDPCDHKRGYGLSALIQCRDEVIGFDGVLVRAIVTLGHFSSIVVKPGQIVKTGDLLGFMGATGNATGPHSHLQVEAAGDYPRRPMRPLLVWQ